MSQQPRLARGPALLVSLVLSLAAGIVLLAPVAGANPQPQSEQRAAEPRVTAVPEAVIKKFKLDTTFYKKHVDYKGFSILSSATVSDAALLEARYLIDQLLCEREDILKAMIKAGCRFMVMAPTVLGQARPRPGRQALFLRRGKPADPQGRSLPQREHPHPRVQPRRPPARPPRGRAPVRCPAARDLQESDGQGIVERHLHGDQS